MLHRMKSYKTAVAAYTRKFNRAIVRQGIVKIVAAVGPCAGLALSGEIAI